MNSRSLMFLAAGNLPAALYHERKMRRWSGLKIDDESVEASSSISGHGNSQYVGHLEPLKTFQPTRDKLEQIIGWLYQAKDAELTTCKLGIVTSDGNMVSWSYRTRIEILANSYSSVKFSGKFFGLPVGFCFSKIVITMKNGDEIARRNLDHAVLVTEGIVHVTASYTLRFK